jgi:hypothetical protein
MTILLSGPSVIQLFLNKFLVIWYVSIKKMAILINFVISRISVENSDSNVIHLGGFIWDIYNIHEDLFVPFALIQGEQQ